MSSWWVATRWWSEAEYNKSGRNSAVVKMKAQRTCSLARRPSRFKADDKFEVVQLERKEVTYSYFADPMYVFMDAEYEQFEVEAENMTDALKYLEDGLACEVVFTFWRQGDFGRLPNSVVREVHLHRTGGQGRYLGQGPQACHHRHRLRTDGAGLRRDWRQDRDRYRTDEYRNRVK